MIIFLTGSTGFVGGELLVNLSKRAEVEKIYCFIRSDSDEEALIRLKKVFSLHGDFFDRNKIIPICGNLFDVHLSQSLAENKNLGDVDVIIHSAANTSFSRIYDEMVEEVNINGLEKLLRWAKDLPHLQTFLYIGTATICGKDITGRVVYEDESPNITANHLVRYTYTKMQGELLLDKYLPKEKTLIARPSIIMGDSRPVTPRSPVILWAVATINQLRFVPVNEHSMLDMVPVNYAAESIISLLFAKRNHRIYHISSGGPGSTSVEKLSQSLDHYFQGLPPFHFVHKSLLSQVKQWTKNKLKPDSELLKYGDYLNYWKKTFDNPSDIRILLAGLGPYLEFIELGQAFDNTRLLQDVPTIKQSIPAHEYIKNCMPFIEKINILEGAIDP